MFQYISIVLILVAGLSFLVVFGTQLVICFRAQNQCHGIGTITKLCIFIFGLISLFFAGLVILFAVVNFSVGGMCDFAYKGTLKDGSVGTVAETVPVSLKTLLSVDCMKQDTVGVSIDNYLALPEPDLKTQLTNIGTFLNGFSYFRNFLKGLDQDASKNSITRTSDYWDLYRTGIIYNFNNIEGKFWITGTRLRIFVEISLNFFIEISLNILIEIILSIFFEFSEIILS